VPSRLAIATPVASADDGDKEQGDAEQARDASHGGRLSPKLARPCRGSSQMIAVWMMKATVDKVIGVISMGHWFVAAAGSMDMPKFMTSAGNSVAVGIFSRSPRSHVFVDVIAMHVVQMAVVQIINVAVVLYCICPQSAPWMWLWWS